MDVLDHIKKAIAGRSIAACSVDDIEELVLLCCSHFGMGMQSETQLDITRTHIQKWMTKYTWEEIEYAFTLIDLQKVSTKTISPDLVVKIMREYDVIKSSEVNKSKAPVIVHKKKAVYTDKTKENAYKFVTDHIMKYNEIPRGAHWLFIYDYFKLKGMGWFSLSQKERTVEMNEFSVIVDAQLKREAQQGNSTSIARAKDAISNIALRRCQYRSRYIQKYFKGIITKTNHQ